LVELAAECLDYKKMLYREYGQTSHADELATGAGDTIEWRRSLDFADQVDAIKVLWDNTKEWTVAQIVETNPSTQLLKLRYEKCFETEDRWVGRFSNEIAPHKSQSLRAAMLLQEWKQSLQPGTHLDAQDTSFKSWCTAVVGKRREPTAQTRDARAWQQQDSAQITIIMTAGGREVESEFLSVESPRLARAGTRVGGGAAVFADLDDANDPDDPTVFACDHGKTYGCPSLIAAINCFGDAGGFEAIRERLARAAQHTAEPAAEEEEGGSSSPPCSESLAAPVQMVEACISIMSNTRMLLARPFATTTLPIFKDAVRSNLNHLSDDQLRGLTIQAHERVVAGLTLALERLFTNIDISEYTELLSLDIALKCFRCPLMEKKLGGFKTILEMLEGVKWNKAGWVTTQFMVSWVLQEKLALEVFGGASVCVPIVERSADLLNFLIREKSLTQEHLKLVWGCSLTKDETTRLAVYKVIKETSLYLQVVDLQFIFDQVDAIPVGGLTEPTVNLVFDLAKNAAYRATVLAERALELLWKWMLDSSAASASIASLSETKLVEVLRQTYSMKEQREPLLSKCTAFIARSDSVPQCMAVMWKVADLLVRRHFLTGPNISSRYADPPAHRPRKLLTVRLTRWRSRRGWTSAQRRLQSSSWNSHAGCLRSSSPTSPVTRSGPRPSSPRNPSRRPRLARSSSVAGWRT
jgi:hypothetical protein